MIQARLPLGNGCDALLFTDLVDVRWLTGFTGSNGWVVVTADDLVLGTDGRYGERARAETASSGATVIAETLASEAARTPGRDARGGHGRSASIPPRPAHAEWSRLARRPRCCSRPISRSGCRRQIKDAAEIERIDRGRGGGRCGARRGRAVAVRHRRSPVTEADIRNELEYRMRLHGAGRPQLRDHRGQSGPDHAARPHHEPRRPNGSSRATPSSSTSARSSTATTPT